MKRPEIELLMREAGKLAHEWEFVIIGSQAAHAFTAKPPAEVLLSRECDIYPKNRPETANFLTLNLGKKSPFARKHGYFADLVAPELATIPAGWESRLKSVELGPVTAWCLEIHDLVISKLAAGRLKDLEFAAAMLELRLAKRATLVKRIEQLDDPRDRERVKAKLTAVLDDIKSGQASEHPRAKIHPKNKT
jgi:hypothetical protein